MSMHTQNDFRSNLLNEDLYDLNIALYVEKVKANDNILIWGTGGAGQSVYNFLDVFHMSENVKYFADNNKAAWGTTKNELLVLSPEEVLKKVETGSINYIIVAAMHLAEIRKQLLTLGVKDSIIDVRGYGLVKDYFTFRNTSPYKIINSHYDEYERAYTFLSDDRSKTVYMGILNSKIALDNKYMEGISSASQYQYFDREIIELSENEVFCDCGSYNGDTLETFVALSGGKYNKYIAIEANKDIYAELNKKIAERGYKNIKTHNLACWNEPTVLKFEPALESGHITGTGRILIQADTLDNILKDESVTFLKMDIEGAEEMALNGAHRVINENRPVLAICIYHSLEDYYKIPLILKELDPNYRLFVRHYRDMVDAETVCYAIPIERLVCKSR